MTKAELEALIHNVLIERTSDHEWVDEVGCHLAEALEPYLAPRHIDSDHVTYVSAEQFAKLMKDDDDEPPAELRQMVARRRTPYWADEPHQHEWAVRGSGPDDRWRECWNCGETEDWR